MCYISMQINVPKAYAQALTFSLELHEREKYISLGVEKQAYPPAALHMLYLHHNILYC